MILVRALKTRLNGLFSTNDYGIVCIGEQGHEMEIGDGGRRQIFCVVISDDTTEYNLVVKSVESLRELQMILYRNGYWIKIGAELFLQDNQQLQCFF